MFTMFCVLEIANHERGGTFELQLNRRCFGDELSLKFLYFHWHDFQQHSVSNTRVEQQPDNIFYV